jgi:hypothetical protein
MTDPAHTCPRCDGPCTQVARINDGPEFLTCGPCLAAAMREADALRERFEALVASGMTRENANLSMILAVRQRPPTAPLPRYPVG